MSGQHARPVVVGVAGNPGSAGALRYAVAEAERRQAPLHLVHVMPVAPLAPLTPLAPSGPGSETELRTVATSILRTAHATALELAPDSRSRPSSATGPAARYWSRPPRVRSSSSSAVRLTMGVERLLTGATTAAVAGRAACDVVVVPSFWTHDHLRGLVVAGVKTQDQAHELLGVAFAEASARGATLRLVTAWQLPDPYLDRIEVRTHSEDWEAEGQRVLTTLLTDWRAAYPDVPVDIRIKHGRAGTVLLEASRESDLLVLCRRRHGVHPHGHLGGVAYALLQASDVPVLVVPATRSEAVPDVELKLEDAGIPLK